MNEAEQTRIRDAWLSLPAAVRSEPASEGELAEFEARHGPIPAEFRWFLSVCGGGPVGSERVDGIAELPKSHSRFQQQSNRPRGWTMRDVFIIGWDGAGNPFGIHRPTGELRVEDHNFGGVHCMAKSFSEFLSKAFTDTNAA
jgi:hypothetical protein